MILALGQNINSTLSTSPELFLANLRDVTEELAVDTIEWSGWGGTIGLGKSGLTIWGFAPSTLHLEPCPLPPTAVNLPFRARAFVGSESLEAVVDEAGHLCVPDETSGCWSFAEDRDEGGWLDVQQFGTGDFLGLHANDPSRVVRAASIAALYDQTPARRRLSPATATFSRIVAAASHALLVPTAPHLHPPHAIGTNLHSQLGRPISAALVEDPVALDLLEGLGRLVLRAAGVYSLALTDAGDVYLWGGRFGLPDKALDFSEFETPTLGAGAESPHIIAASVGSTGAVVLCLSDGRVIAAGVEEADRLPTRPADGVPARPRSEAADEGLEWKELRGVEGGGRLKDVVVASGGRGWFLVYD